MLSSSDQSFNEKQLKINPDNDQSNLLPSELNLWHMGRMASDFVGAATQSTLQRSHINSIVFLTELIKILHFQSLSYLDLLHHFNQNKFMVRGPKIVDDLWNVALQFVHLQHFIFVDWCIQQTSQLEGIDDSNPPIDNTHHTLHHNNNTVFNLGPKLLLYDEDEELSNSEPSQFLKCWRRTHREVSDRFFSVVFGSFVSHFDSMENEISKFLIDHKIDTTDAQLSRSGVSMNDLPTTTNAHIETHQNESSQLLLRTRRLATFLAFCCSKLSQGLHLGLSLSLRAEKKNNKWSVVDRSKRRRVMSSLDDEESRRNIPSSYQQNSNFNILANLIHRMKRLASMRLNGLNNIRNLLNGIIGKIYEEIEIAMEWYDHSVDYLFN